MLVKKLDTQDDFLYTESVKYSTGGAENMTRAPYPPDTQVNPRKTWVQTERKAHEDWADLIKTKPTAAMVLHKLVARMENKNAVVISQKVLAQLVGCHERTITRAVADLVKANWIDVKYLNGPGTVAGYIINDRVAWGEKRENLRLSQFSANVIVSADDQPPEMLENTQPLKSMPALYPGEIQLPAGDGAEPPAQALLPGTEPDLPVRDYIDRATGEVLSAERLDAELNELAETGRAAVEHTIRRQQQELADLLASIKAPPLPPR